MDTRDIPHWVVGVMQILHSVYVLKNLCGQAVLPCIPGSFQLLQSKSQCIILISCVYAVGIFDASALAFGIIINISDKRGSDGLTVILRTAQIDRYAFKQIRFVKRGSIDAAIGRGDADSPI